MNTLANSPLTDRSDFIAPTMESAAVSISWFYNDIPPFVEAELLRLYQNPFSTLAKFRTYNLLDKVSTYVVRKHGKIVTIFLFRHDGQQVKVLNEFLKTDEEELNRFARHIFSTFKSVDAINFGPTHTEFTKLAFPCHRIDFNEDIVTSLPGCTEEYQAGLGRSTRQNINHTEKKLKRQFPTLSTIVQENEDIDEHQFRSVIKLNQERMASKSKVHGIDEQEVQRLYTLAKTAGLLLVLSIDGKICAGAICCRAGPNFFLYVIAHDSGFDALGLGTYCCYCVICECISRDGKEFHFLWGREQYKYRFLGVQQDFGLLTIYRSRMKSILDARKIVVAEAKAQIRQVKLWLLAPERRERAILQLAVRFIRAMRRARQEALQKVCNAAIGATSEEEFLDCRKTTENDRISPNQWRTE